MGSGFVSRHVRLRCDNYLAWAAAVRLLSPMGGCAAATISAWAAALRLLSRH